MFSRRYPQVERKCLQSAQVAEASLSAAAEDAGLAISNLMSASTYGNMARIVGHEPLAETWCNIWGDGVAPKFIATPSNAKFGR